MRYRYNAPAAVTVVSGLITCSKEQTGYSTPVQEFTVCRRVIELGSLAPEYELTILGLHIVYMIQNDNYDALDVYNLLDNRLTEEVGSCGRSRTIQNDQDFIEMV